MGDLSTLTQLAERQPMGGGPGAARGTAGRWSRDDDFGAPEPLGVTAKAGGVDVAVYSAHADAVHFCLFDEAGAREVERIRLRERTGDVHHGFVPGVALGARYGLRAHGRFEPSQGHRFDPSKLLVDPYCLAVDRPFTLHPSTISGAVPVDSAACVPKGIVVAPEAVEPWAAAPSWSRTSIAELHVRGFSMLNPDVPPSIRGTWAGLAADASIHHLTALGVSTVEVMPAAAWIDERHLGPLGLTNFWGYNPVSFMAPDPRLAPGGWAEIRAATAALNAAGIEVLLDVVYNHSGEGDEFGPTLSLRGLDNATYYRLDPADPARYVNDAGCGNILAAERRPVVRLVLDALRAWARFGGINGFRFDLMTVLGRRPQGFDIDAPIIAAIEQDPLLRRLKLIAEPWDIGPGGYQVGAFGAGWGEWNDRFRDDVRRFWRGDGAPAALATRIAGSADLFGLKRRPSRSVNFVTAHDGFTLDDLVSFEHKHNERNGEDNRDGTDSNWSWNHGVEGASDDAAVLCTRRRDQLNLLVTLLLSRGTPMLGPGAEVGHSQGGNNNAYAQDNAISWIDWSRPEAAFTGFIRRLLDLRAQHPAFGRDRFLTGTAAEGSLPDVVWQLPDGRAPTAEDWTHPATQTLVCVFAAANAGGPQDRAVLALNAGREDVGLVLPPLRPGARWRIAVDTADEAAAAKQVEDPAGLKIGARSALVLIEDL